MSTTVASTSRKKSPRVAPTYVLIAAWAIPVMVIGQFSMIAIIPVAMVLVGVWWHAQLRSLRWAAGLLSAVYATPLAIYLIRPDRAESLSKDMHPALLVAIVVAAVIMLVATYARKR